MAERSINDLMMKLAKRCCFNARYVYVRTHMAADDNASDRRSLKLTEHSYTDKGN